MRYFHYLSPEEQNTLFFLPPEKIDVCDKDMLEHALGATLYMPATRPRIVSDMVAGKVKGLMSMVVCLEDAIGDREVAAAERMVIEHFQGLAASVASGELSAEELPLIFLRVRNVGQMKKLADSLAPYAAFLAGFVFPKFTLETGLSYMDCLAEINKLLKKKVYGMPILESPEMMYAETRSARLLEIKALLDSYRDYILNVRIGATDLCGIFGLRRSPDLTIYDIAPIRDCIADIVNVFGRPDSGGYVISGPVWEFYSSERMLKPQLRQGTFTDRLGQAGGRLRNYILDRYIDGLIHECILDKANGLSGKTIIHPSHIKPVQSLCVVTHEEYMDASSIIANAAGEVGVLASQYANKMNEVKPHYRWAQKIVINAKIYGVFNDEHNFTNLLGREGLV